MSRRARLAWSDAPEIVALVHEMQRANERLQKSIQEVAAQRSLRDEAIRRLAAAGMTFVQIAELAEIAETTVIGIVNQRVA